MLNQELIQNPREFKYLQSTVSSKFSQGAPNPKKPTENLPPKNLKAVAADLRKEPTAALNFPALKVFTVDDPDTYESLTFSLDTRRLLTFVMGKVPRVKTKPAPIRELRGSLWKMTHEDGGYTQPTMTDINARKDAEPQEYTTLFKLKQAILKASRKEDAACALANIVGDAKEQRLDQAVQAKLVRKFNLR